MRAYVTGATGFVGAHVARELAEQGAEVSTQRVDLRDADAIAGAIAGCDAVFHVAALYSFDADDGEMQAINVRGTQNVIDACRAHGVRRLVHTSTAGTCGPAIGRTATELDDPPDWELSVAYKRTKLEAEQAVLAAVEQGLDAVIVNPTAPVGDGDHKPTPTGRMVAGVATGKIRGYVSTTGLNVVDVRDVAHGHVLAHERGAAGERYLLGGENMSLKELFARIAALAERGQPRIKVPYTVARIAASVGLANPDEVRLARLPMYFSSKKAENLLDYRTDSVDNALARAVEEALQRERVEKGEA